MLSIAALLGVALTGLPGHAAALVGTASAATNTLMSVTGPPGAYLANSDANPEYSTRSLSFTVAWDDTYYPGDTIQCSLSTEVGGNPAVIGPWESCGPPRGGACPAAACNTYAPSLPQDAVYSITTRLVDATGAVEGGAGYAEYDFSVDTTPPATRLALDYLGGSSPSGDGRHAALTFSSTDPTATFQCSVTEGAASAGPWKACRSDAELPFTFPLSTALFHVHVRAVDVFGRPDPQPLTAALSPIPCRARLLTHARTLTALGRGIRVRITCVEPSGWHFLIIPHSRQATRLGIAELAGYTGVMRRAGQSRTIRVKALPLSASTPALLDAFLRAPIPVTYVTEPGNETYSGFGAPQVQRGRLAPSG